MTSALLAGQMATQPSVAPCKARTGGRHMTNQLGVWHGNLRRGADSRGHGPDGARTAAGAAQTGRGQPRGTAQTGRGQPRGQDSGGCQDAS